MAKMYITEYKEIAYAGHGLQVPQEPPVTVQEVNFTTSVASAAFDSETQFISVQLDADGYVQFGAAPTAVNTADSRTSRLHVANAVTFHGVNKDLKVAAITA